MKRFDFFLLVAVLLTVVAVEAVRSSVPPSNSHGQPAQEKIQSAQDVFDPKLIEKRLQENPALKRRFQIFAFGVSLAMVVSMSYLIQ